MADGVGDQLAEDELGVLGVFAKAPAEERLADLVAGVPGLGQVPAGGPGRRKARAWLSTAFAAPRTRGGYPVIGWGLPRDQAVAAAGWLLQRIILAADAMAAAPGHRLRPTPP